MVALNKGTSGRSYLNPLGNTSAPSVKYSNSLASRITGSYHKGPCYDYLTLEALISAQHYLQPASLLRMVLVLLLVEAMQGAWLVEQARSSVLMQLPRFKLLRQLSTVITLISIDL